MTSRVVRTATKQPGKLLAAGLKELGAFLEHKVDASTGEELPPRVLTYLLTVFHATVPPSKCGPALAQELRTLAIAIDLLCAGKLDELGDVLMQRFQSAEIRASSGSAQEAQRLEVVQATRQGLAPQELRAAATKEEARELRLKDLRQRLGSKGNLGAH